MTTIVIIIIIITTTPPPSDFFGHFDSILDFGFLILNCHKYTRVLICGRCYQNSARRKVRIRPIEVLAGRDSCRASGASVVWRNHSVSSWVCFSGD